MTHGTVIELFSDEDATTPLAGPTAADGPTDLAGTAITSVTVYGVEIPPFLGTTLGERVVYGRVAGATGKGFPIYAVDASAAAAETTFNPATGQTPNLPATATNVQTGLEEVYKRAEGKVPLTGGNFTGPVSFGDTTDFLPGAVEVAAVGGLIEWLRARLPEENRPPIVPYPAGTTPVAADYPVGTIFYSRTASSVPFAATVKLNQDIATDLSSYSFTSITTVAESKFRMALVMTGDPTSPDSSPESFALWGLAWTKSAELSNSGGTANSHRWSIYTSFGIPSVTSDAPVVGYGTRVQSSCSIYVLEFDALKGNGIRTPAVAGAVPQIAMVTNSQIAPPVSLPAAPLAGNPILMWHVQNNTTHTVLAGPGFVLIGDQLSGAEPSRLMRLQLDADGDIDQEREFATDAGGNSVKIVGIVELDLVS